MSPSQTELSADVTALDVAASDDEATTRGRPRDADRTTAILDAAVEVMHDVGWDGFKVQEVASRAGAGLATIYRRFPTKEDLVAAAMRHDTDYMSPAEMEGAPREVLALLLTRLGDKMCGTGGSVISVLAAARDHPAMQAALDDAIHGTVRNGITDLLGALLGADHPQRVTLTDAIMGALIFRAGMLEVDTPGSEFATEMLGLVDAVAS